MLTADKVISGGRGLSAVLLRRAAELALDWDTRQKSRFEAVDSSGRAVGVFLPRGTRLRGGDVLVVSDGSLLRVAAVAQPVLAVRRRREGGSPPDLLRAAYHLGNRHVALEIGADRLQLEPDPVLADMLRRMGLAVSEEVAPFEPEGGAYGAAGGHGHAHGHAEPGQVHGPGCDHHDHGHGHGHGDAHAHGHAEPGQVHGPGCDHHDHRHGHGHGDAHAHGHAEPGHVHGPGCGHPEHDPRHDGAHGVRAAAPHVHGPDCRHGDAGGEDVHGRGAVARPAAGAGHEPGAPDGRGRAREAAHEQAHGLADAPPTASPGHGHG